VKTYALNHPREGYRRLAWMMIDEEIAFVSPSSVYRILDRNDLLCRWKPSSAAGQKPEPPTPSPAVAYRSDVPLDFEPLVLFHRSFRQLFPLDCGLGTAIVDDGSRRHGCRSPGFREIPAGASPHRARQWNSVYQQGLPQLDQTIFSGTDPDSNPPPGVKRSHRAVSPQFTPGGTLAPGTARPAASQRHHCRLDRILQYAALACGTGLSDSKRLAGRPTVRAIRRKEKKVGDGQNPADSRESQASQPGICRGRCPRTLRIYRLVRSRYGRSINDFLRVQERNVNRLRTPGARVTSQYGPILPVTGDNIIERRRGLEPTNCRKSNFR